MRFNVEEKCFIAQNFQSLIPSANRSKQLLPCGQTYDKKTLTKSNWIYVPDQKFIGFID